MSISKGYTLAEVLISLAIIGFIAAMVIPSMVSKTSDEDIVLGVKKAYYTLSTAQRMMIGKKIRLNDSSAGRSGADDNFMNAFVQVLKVNKVCGADSGCFPDVDYPELDGTEVFSESESMWYINNHSELDKIILSDGSLLAFWDPPEDGCTFESGDYKEMCGSVHVDVNGFAGPNQRGIDLFTFIITRTQVIPQGAKDDPSAICDAINDGATCTAKVISEGAINY